MLEQIGIKFFFGLFSNYFSSHQSKLAKEFNDINIKHKIS